MTRVGMMRGTAMTPTGGDSVPFFTLLCLVRYGTEQGSGCSLVKSRENHHISRHY